MKCWAGTALINLAVEGVKGAVAMIDAAAGDDDFGSELELSSVTLAATISESFYDCVVLDLIKYWLDFSEFEI